MKSRFPIGTCVAWAIAVQACTGGVGGGSGRPPSGTAGASGGGGGGSGSVGAGTGTGGDAAGTGAAAGGIGGGGAMPAVTGGGGSVPVGTTTRVGTPTVSRLSQVQWANSVRDLLLLQSPGDLTLATPDAVVRLDNEADSLFVNQSLHDDLQAAAERLAAQVAGDPAAIARLVPANSPADASGKGQVAALNENGSINSPTNPAAAGSILVLYATGGGIMNPTVPDGMLVDSTPLPAPLLPVRVVIGGRNAEVIYAGAAPRLVSGALQINTRVPAGTVPGAATITLSVGTASSPEGCIASIR